MATVHPCPIDLNKCVPMYLGVSTGVKVEIASNVEIEFFIQINSNVYMDTSLEIVSTEEIESNDDNKLSRYHLVVNPAVEVTVEDEKQDETPFKHQTEAKWTIPMSKSPIIHLYSHRHKKRGKKSWVPAKVHKGQAVIESFSTAIPAKPEPKLAPVTWREKIEPIEMAKEREKDCKTIPSTQYVRVEKEAASLGNELNNSMNGEPSSMCSAGVSLTKDDSISMVIEAVVAAAAQHGSLRQPSDERLLSLLGSENQESGAGSSTHTSDNTELNGCQSNSCINVMSQLGAPKKSSRKKLLRGDTETSESECSDGSSKKKMMFDWEHGTNAAARTSFLGVKRSQRSHKIKGCYYCNDSITKKKGVGLNLRKQ